MLKLQNGSIKPLKIKWNAGIYCFDRITEKIVMKCNDRFVSSEIISLAVTLSKGQLGNLLKQAGVNNLLGTPFQQYMATKNVLDKMRKTSVLY